MRPKYSSPGAEPLNCSHFKCAHLLFVASHGSFFDEDATGVAFGAAASTGALRPGAMYNRPVLATAIVSDSVGSVRLTCENSPFGRRSRRRSPLGNDRFLECKRPAFQMTTPMRGKSLPSRSLGKQ